MTFPSLCISLRWARLSRRPESNFSGEDCLSGASFRAILIRAGGPVPRSSAHAQNMVLVTFAETKVTRRAGPKPRINNFEEKNNLNSQLTMSGMTYLPLPLLCQPSPCPVESLIHGTP
jgi:hypothetical protein